MRREGEKRFPVGGGEQDALTRWRHLLYWEAGKRRYWKNRAVRRSRRAARDEIRRGLE